MGVAIAGVGASFRRPKLGGEIPQATGGVCLSLAPGLRLVKIPGGRQASRTAFVGVLEACTPRTRGYAAG